MEDLQQDKLSEHGLVTFINQIEESGDILQVNLRRASEIITSFKQLAVSQSDEHIQRFDLHTHLELMVLTLKPKLQENSISIDFQCPENVFVTCDPTNLSQVIDNLILNALVHGYSGVIGGVILVKVIDMGEQVQIVVQDRGHGISAENLEHVFEPFFTTTRGSGGTGLGMHLVYNIVHQNLKGTISCESKLGKGTSFIVTMPSNISG